MQSITMPTAAAEPIRTPSRAGAAMEVVWRVLGLAALVAFLTFGVWMETMGHIPSQVLHEMGRSQ